jgi:hypothetical protein
VPLEDDASGNEELRGKRERLAKNSTSMILSYHLGGHHLLNLSAGMATTSKRLEGPT